MFQWTFYPCARLDNTVAFDSNSDEYYISTVANISIK